MSTKAQRSNEDTDRAVEVGKCPSDLIGVGKVYAGRYIDFAWAAVMIERAHAD